LQIKTKIASCHTPDSKPVKQEVNSTTILPPSVFTGVSYRKETETVMTPLVTRRPFEGDDLTMILRKFCENHSDIFKTIQQDRIIYKHWARFDRDGQIV
jgi:hypothetical protein